MTTAESLSPTQDERIMGALSHISVLLPLLGVVAPIFIWVTQREKSKYVAFQSLQAMAYQLLMIFAYFLAMGCYIVSFFGSFIFIPFTSGSDSVGLLPSVGMIIPFLVIAFVFLGGFVFILYGLIGAIMVFQGKPFHYVVIGNKVEKYMAQKVVGGEVSNQ
jgi:uncharacterized Tic20 family protein